MNLHAIAIWTGIVGSAAGVGFPAYQTHKADQANIAAQRQADVQRAVKEQAEHDRPWQTLNDYQRHFNLLDENLPAQERRIAKAMFAQMQAQQAVNEIKLEAQPIMAERMRVMRLEPEPITANAPKEEKPQ
jgi:predicted negative regulator of RcsB-dependent stress response